jgi:creatinine amidohydrolase/Fe(II)-dependent formamide hydrolase-like protein
MDWTDGPLSFMPHWSAITESGVTGDAAAGTVEKGRIWLEQARKEIAEFIGEVAVRPRNPGVDHH